MSVSRAVVVYLALALAVVTHCAAQTSRPSRVTLESVESHGALPVTRVTAGFEPIRRLVQLSAGQVPEGTLIISAISLGQKPFHLTLEQVTALTTGFREAYAKIGSDPEFSRVPSAMADTASSDAKRAGSYFLYRPARITSQTPSIIFLHGFGGNFQFYTWLLKEEFPDHIVIAPSYGVAWNETGRGFLADVLVDAERKLGIELSRPWLFAISAAGPAGFSFYNDDPSRFRGLVCIASCPAAEQIPKLKETLSILMLNGTKDDRFPIAAVRALIKPLLDRPNFVVKELDGDHFFLLTLRESTFAALKEFTRR